MVTFARHLASLVPVVLTLAVVAPAAARSSEPPVDVIVGDGMFESPNFGFRVTWTDPWQEPTDADDVAHSEDGYDSLNLDYRPDGESVATINITGSLVDEGATPAAFIQEMADFHHSSEFVDAYGDVTILLEEQSETAYAILFYANGDDDREVSRVEYRVDPTGSFFQRIDLDAAAAEFVEVYEATQDAVTIDDAALFRVLGDDETIDIASAFIGDLDPGTTGAAPADTAVAENLVGVRAHLGQLSATVPEYMEIIELDELTAAQTQRGREILTLWSIAPELANEVSFAGDQRDVQQAYIAYTDTLAAAATAFNAFLAMAPNDPDEQRVLDEFHAAIDVLPGLEAELARQLDEEGA